MNLVRKPCMSESNMHLGIGLSCLWAFSAFAQSWPTINVNTIRQQSGSAVTVSPISANPDFKLEVDGELGVKGQSVIMVDPVNKNIQFGDIRGGDGMMNRLTFKTADTERMLIDQNGNVGIGTSSPSDKLTIVGSVKVTDNVNGNIFLAGDSEGARIVIGKNQGGNRDFRIIDRAYPSNTETELLRIKSSGLVGLGVSSPQYSLDLSTNSKINVRGAQGAIYVNNISPNTGSDVTFAPPSANPDFRVNVIGEMAVNGQSVAMVNTTAKSVYLGDIRGGDGFMDNLIFRTQDQDRMAINYSGNVGIGNTAPQAKLHVSGDARIDGQITVTSITTKVWSVVPDYVFESDYQVRPLQDVEKFVRKHKHLPEIPSAKEISEKGIDLAEMNMKLLKKVEELTLYMIDQKNEIHALKTKVTSLEKTQK